MDEDEKERLRKEIDHKKDMRYMRNWVLLGGVLFMLGVFAGAFQENIPALIVSIAGVLYVGLGGIQVMHSYKTDRLHNKLADAGVIEKDLLDEECD